MEHIDKKTDIIVLTAEQNDEMNRNIKVAILKQMHQKGMFTDRQLNELINMQQ